MDVCRQAAEYQDRQAACGCRDIPDTSRATEGETEQNRFTEMSSGLKRTLLGPGAPTFYTFWGGQRAHGKPAVWGLGLQWVPYDSSCEGALLCSAVPCTCAEFAGDAGYAGPRVFRSSQGRGFLGFFEMLTYACIIRAAMRATTHSSVHYNSAPSLASARAPGQ